LGRNEDWTRKDKPFGLFDTANTERDVTATGFAVFDQGRLYFWDITLTAEVLDGSPFGVDVFAPGPYRFAGSEFAFTCRTGLAVTEGYGSEPFVVIS
jgi:hypothetical protein